MTTVLTPKINAEQNVLYNNLVWQTVIHTQRHLQNVTLYSHLLRLWSVMPQRGLTPC